MIHVLKRIREDPECVSWFCQGLSFSSRKEMVEEEKLPGYSVVLPSVWWCVTQISMYVCCFYNCMWNSHASSTLSSWTWELPLPWHSLRRSQHWDFDVSILSCGYGSLKQQRYLQIDSTLSISRMPQRLSKEKIIVKWHNKQHPPIESTWVNTKKVA